MPPCGGDWVTIEVLILPLLPFLHRRPEARHVCAPGCDRSVVSRFSVLRITFLAHEEAGGSIRLRDAKGENQG